MKKDRFLDVLAVLIILAIGLAIGLMLKQPPENRSDVIGLVGALVGSSLTVIGAVVVLDWDRRLQARDRIDIVTKLLDEILANAADVRLPRVIALFNAKPAFAQGMAVKSLLQSIELAKSTLNQFPPTTIEMVKAYSLIADIKFIDSDFDEKLKAARMYDQLVDFGDVLNLVEFRTHHALAVLGVREMPPEALA